MQEIRRNERWLEIKAVNWRQQWMISESWAVQAAETGGSEEVEAGQDW